MKQSLILILLLTLFACEKDFNENEPDTAFQIVRVNLFNGAMTDSIIFSYNDKKELLQVEKISDSGLSSTLFTVRYYSDKIENWDGIYYKNADDKIYSRTNDKETMSYTYDNNLLVHEIRTWDNEIVTNETYHFYENSNSIKDSSIHYDPNDEQVYKTVYQNIYTDSIFPDFVIGYSGLFEIPLKSKKMLRFSEANKDGILYKYSYNISENELIQNQLFYDTFYDIAQEMWTTKYTYIDKN